MIKHKFRNFRVTKKSLILRKDIHKTFIKSLITKLQLIYQRKIN